MVADTWSSGRDRCSVPTPPGPPCFFDARVHRNILGGMGRLGIGRVLLAGADAFLADTGFYAACERFQSVGIQVVLSCGTFPGESEADAGAVAARLKTSGVRLVLFTVDGRSQPEVPVESIRNAVLASAAHDMHYEIHFRSIAPRHARRVLKALNPVSVRSALVRTLGSRNSDPEVPAAGPVRAGRASPGCATLDHPAVLSDGRVVACCDALVSPCCPPGEGSPLILGDLTNEDLTGIFLRMSRNPALVLLRKYGPNRVWRMVLERGGLEAGPGEETDGGKSHCALCRALFGDGASASRVFEALSGLEVG